MPSVKTSGYRSRLRHAGGVPANTETISKSKNRNARLRIMLQRVSSVEMPSRVPAEDRQGTSSSSVAFPGKARKSAGDFNGLSRPNTEISPEGNRSSLKRSFDTAESLSRHTQSPSMRRLPSWLSRACGSLSPGHPLRQFGPPTPPFTESPDTSREEVCYRKDNSAEVLLDSAGSHGRSLPISAPDLFVSRSSRPIKPLTNPRSGAHTFPVSGPHRNHAQSSVSSFPTVSDDFTYPSTHLPASRSSLFASPSPGSAALSAYVEQDPSSYAADQANFAIRRMGELRTNPDSIMSSPPKRDNELPASPVIYSSVEIKHPSTRKIMKFDGFASTTRLLSMSPVPTISMNPLSHQPHPPTNNVYSNQILRKPLLEPSLVQDDAVSVALRANQSFFAPRLGVTIPAPADPKRPHPMTPMLRRPMHSFPERPDSIDVPTDISVPLEERSELSIPFTCRNPYLETPSTSALESPFPFRADPSRHRLKRKRDMYSDRLLEYASYVAEDAPIPALILRLGLGSEGDFPRPEICGSMTPDQGDKHDQRAVTLQDLYSSLDVHRPPPDLEPTWALSLSTGDPSFQSEQTPDKVSYSSPVPTTMACCIPRAQVARVDSTRALVYSDDHTSGFNFPPERLSNWTHSLFLNEIEDDATEMDELLAMMSPQAEEPLRISSSPSLVDSWSNEDVLSYLKGERESASV